VLTEQLDWFN